MNTDSEWDVFGNAVVQVLAKLWFRLQQQRLVSHATEWRKPIVQQHMLRSVGV